MSHVSSKIKYKKIMMSGGGTGGSVAPLVAVWEELKNDNNFSFVWVGTKEGVEKEMLKNTGIKFLAISSGKLRRYWSWQNLLDIFLINIGFWQALPMLMKEKPNVIITAGSFVSVPLVWAGWLLRIPVLVHQQDAVPGLANKLMAPMAQKKTVALEKSLSDYGKRAEWIGNPIRKELVEVKVSRQEALTKLGLTASQPVLLVLGGGTGALPINELIKNNLPELLKFCQLVHITGQGKSIISTTDSNYHSFEFLDTFGLIKVFAAADVVISRCGMNVLTELSYLGKPSILIPIPDSHQEANAKIFAEKNAAVVLAQDKISNQEFVARIKNLINDKNTQNELSANIQTVIKKGANERLVEIVRKIIS